jgi:hypothetical protein
MIETNSEGQTKETPMENFFSLTGINFGNIRENDQAITDKITSMVKDGWAIANITSGVYGADKSTGIFVTRYLFRKDEKK